MEKQWIAASSSPTCEKGGDCATPGQSGVGAVRRSEAAREKSDRIASQKRSGSSETCATGDSPKKRLDDTETTKMRGEAAELDKGKESGETDDMTEAKKKDRPAGDLICSDCGARFRLRYRVSFLKIQSGIGCFGSAVFSYAYGFSIFKDIWIRTVCPFFEVLQCVFCQERCESIFNFYFISSTK